MSEEGWLRPVSVRNHGHYGDNSQGSSQVNGNGLVHSVAGTPSLAPSGSAVVEEDEYDRLTLKVTRFNPGTTPDDISRLFSLYGTVRTATTTRSGSVIFVAFHSETEAEVALRALNGTELNGAVIQVDYVTVRPPGYNSNAGGGGDRDGGRGGSSYYPSQYQSALPVSSQSTSRQYDSSAPPPPPPPPPLPHSPEDGHDDHRDSLSAPPPPPLQQQQQQQQQLSATPGGARDQELDRNRCFACDQSGHWARDCPTKTRQPGGYDGRGMGSGGHRGYDNYRDYGRDRRGGGDWQQRDEDRYNSNGRDSSRERSSESATAAAAAAAAATSREGTAAEGDADVAAPQGHREGASEYGRHGARGTDRECFRCGQAGHIARMCTNPPTNPNGDADRRYSSNRSYGGYVSGGGEDRERGGDGRDYRSSGGLQCYSCGGYGHKSANCPDGNTRDRGGYRGRFDRRPAYGSSHSNSGGGGDWKANSYYPPDSPYLRNNASSSSGMSSDRRDDGYYRSARSRSPVRHHHSHRSGGSGSGSSSGYDRYSSSNGSYANRRDRSRSRSRSRSRGHGSGGGGGSGRDRSRSIERHPRSRSRDGSHDGRRGSGSSARGKSSRSNEYRADSRSPVRSGGGD